MRPSFSLAFLLVGLPILFILRDFIPLDKKLFTYSFMGLNLLLLINYKNLYNARFYFNIPLPVKYIIFIIIILFTFISMYMYSLNDQTMYLFITLYIYLASYTIKGEELNHFFKYVLIISTIAVYLAFLTTPLDAIYWIERGGRFYLGDTRNPGVVSVLTVINFICVLFYITSYNKKIIYVLLLIPLLFISPYLYFLSQGKSTIIGLVLIVFYLLFISLKNIKNNFIKFFKYFLVILIVLPIFYNFFEKYINSFSQKIFAAALSLFGYKSDVIQMSAEIRNTNFGKTWEYMSIDNIFGHGINTFRMDSPFLQTAVDMGYILAILFFFVAIIFPIYLIIKTNYKTLDINTKLAMLLYLFYSQNFFFHGTPYEYSIWLPYLIFIKLISSKEHRKCLIPQS